METYKNELKKAQEYTKYLDDEKCYWHRHFLGLYHSLIEYSDSLICLAENEKGTGIQTIFRGLLEVYVDLKNLSTDEKYVNYMEAGNSKQLLKYFKEANTNKNTWLNDFPFSPLEIDAKIQELETECTKFKQSNYLIGKDNQPISVRKKFEKAGMLQEYNSVYWHLCIHSHNNVGALIERLFNRIQPENDEFTLYLGLGCFYLKNGSYIVHNILKTGYENKFPI